jgi:hypothetical protein
MSMSAHEFGDLPFEANRRTTMIQHNSKSVENASDRIPSSFRSSLYVIVSTSRYVFEPLGIACILLVAAGATTFAQPNVNNAQFAHWGLEVFDRIESELKKENSALYAQQTSLSGAQSGGVGGFAFVWPAGVQFRVLNALVRHDPATFTVKQRAFSNELLNRYWRFSGSAGGYRSGVTSDASVFYDDNAHIVIAELDAFASTGDPVYLQRATNSYNFVLRGEDNVGGGGVWFQENEFARKDTVSTLQAARAAAVLYRATGQQDYLDDATRMLTWANSHVQQSDGLFQQGFDVSTNMPEDVAIINSAGMGISTNIELYKATLIPSYLTEAQRIAARSISRYTDLSTTGRWNPAGQWAFELVDALAALYELDHGNAWADSVHRGLTYLHDVKADVNGHYGLRWGPADDPPQSNPMTSWRLIDQASVARAYLSLSQIHKGLPGDYNEDGVVDTADYTVWRDNFGKSVVRMPNAFGAGAIGAEQYELWRQSFGNSIQSGLGQAAAVPEPSTSVLILIIAISRIAAARSGNAIFPES